MRLAERGLVTHQGQERFAGGEDGGVAQDPRQHRHQPGQHQQQDRALGGLQQLIRGSSKEVARGYLVGGVLYEVDVVPLL